MRMRLLLAVLLGLLTAAPAAAAATAWVELAPGTRVRLITSDRLSADGTTMAAVELDMPAGTKTYWRVPGEGGIPASLDTAGSLGIGTHRFVWPYPTIEQRGGYTDFVYYGPTVLPLEMKLDGAAAATLSASLLLGICSDICIPANAEFTLPLTFGKADTAQEIRIAQALAAAPIPWDGAVGAIGEPQLDAKNGVLRVTIDEGVIDPGTLIADATEAGHLLGAPQKSPEPGVVELPLLGTEHAADFVGKPVQIIFMTRDGPYEVWRTVGASTPGAS
ncbi:MAG TPA: protein-disulfide reductase DsbD family protein [Devosia sp.]|nr:protein-disulfide reductase DsbD family protein [Devosia sp.]